MSDRDYAATALAAARPTIKDEAVDAVLRLVADDLDRAADDADCDCQTDSDVTTCDCIRHLAVGGIRDAAERVRDLLGKDKTNGDA